MPQMQRLLVLQQHGRHACVVKQHWPLPHMYVWQEHPIGSNTSESVTVCVYVAHPLPAVATQATVAGPQPQHLFNQMGQSANRCRLRLLHMPCMLFTHAMVAFVTCTMVLSCAAHKLHTRFHFVFNFIGVCISHFQPHILLLHPNITDTPHSHIFFASHMRHSTARDIPAPLRVADSFIGPFMCCHQMALYVNILQHGILVMLLSSHA
jgi:hypothetical protein